MRRWGRWVAVTVFGWLAIAPAHAAFADADAPKGKTVDVAMNKTLDTAGPYVVGQTISYSLVVTNASFIGAANVQVTDTPTNLTITSVSGGGCTMLPCTLPSVVIGSPITITVTATINATGAFDNSATASANFDSNPANDTDNTGNGGVAGGAADTSIVKTLVTTGPYAAGQQVTYTLAVANAGPSTASGVQVTDTPTNLVINSVSGGGCGTLPCELPPGSLTVGANVTITVVATIVAPGAFDNTATVTANEFDGDSSNNFDFTANGGVAGAASADVSLTKTPTTAGPYMPGQTITYTIGVANAGPSPATAVQITDTPTNLTITGVAGGGCTMLPCTIATLASGASATLNVTATINAAGAFDNSATATAAEADPNAANNTDNTGNGGNAFVVADVSMVKTLVTNAPYVVGQSIAYALTVANAGPATATAIQVTDTPTNLTITSVSGAGCTMFPCTIASLASGANATINVTATINAAGAFDNSATAMGAETDSNQANNTDNAGNGGIAGASADVSLVKTLTTAGPYTVGQAVAYTVVIANAGPSTATAIQVTDTPANLTITSVSGAGCTAFPCTLASLGSGANATITVNATIDAAGTFDNVATATATEADPNPANNTDNAGNGGSAAGIANLGISKTGSAAAPTVGQTFTYTLVASNLGPSTATGVVVTDPLPTGFTLTSSTPTQGTCSGTTTVTCTVGTLPNGASATITLQGQFTGTGTWTNTATAAGAETDNTPGNNAATFVANAGAAAAPVIVPTLDVRGWLAMIAMLLLSATFAIRVRR